MKGGLAKIPCSYCHFHFLVFCILVAIIFSFINMAVYGYKYQSAYLKYTLKAIQHEKLGLYLHFLLQEFSQCLYPLKHINTHFTNHSEITFVTILPESEYDIWKIIAGVFHI